VEQEQEHTSTKTILTAAIVSGALVIGLFIGIPLGNVARDFFSGLSGKDITSINPPRPL
jgi:hypothetical protein